MPARAYRPNDPRRYHGKGKYTPWPGRGPYTGWRIQVPPWPVPSNVQFWNWLGKWLYAPGDSHVHSFGFIDARLDAVIKSGPPAATRPSDWYSVLMVKFKDTAKGYWGEGREYAYFSKNHDRLEFIFLMMADAESPGEIVWSHLISEMIPYMEVK